VRDYSIVRFTNLTEFDFYPRLAQSPGASLVLIFRSALRHMPPGRGGIATGTGRHGGASVQGGCGKSIALAREYEIFHLPALMLVRGRPIFMPGTQPAAGLKNCSRRWRRP